MSANCIWSLGRCCAVGSALLVCGCRHDTDDFPLLETAAQQAQPLADSLGTTGRELHTRTSGEPMRSPRITRDDSLERARALADDGMHNEARSILLQLLLIDPMDYEVMFQLATIFAALGDMAGAIDVLDSIPPDDPLAGLPALGQSADWSVQIGRYAEAERRYREVIRRVPDVGLPHRKLSFLLNCQGRRQEAVVHARELCKLGDVRQDELHSLILQMHAMYDDPAMTDTHGEVCYHPVGPGGAARKLFTDGRFDEAAEVLRDFIASGEAPESLVAFFGRIVTEGQDDDAFDWWLGHTSSSVENFADYWAALGTYMISRGRFEEATHALLQSMDRDPTDLNSAGRLAQTFSTLGNQAASDVWLNRWSEINESLKANNRVSESREPNPNAISELSMTLNQLERRLEAVLWKSIEAQARGLLHQEIGYWNEQRLSLLASNRGFPSREHRLCAFDPAQFPRPSLEKPDLIRRIRHRPKAMTRTAHPAMFRDIASEVGLLHSYQVASKPHSYGFAIYQTIGGAAVAFDYDHDGQVDLYFTQGGCDPPAFKGSQSDQLYRNYDGRVGDVTRVAGTEEYQFSIGATSGDWNQDGFPDLVVTNVGQDLLFINNGDGTFTKRHLSGDVDRGRLPSSVAMADITGDHLPDVYRVVYIEDPGLTKRPEFNVRGEVIAEVMPFQFRPGRDVIDVNDGRGDSIVVYVSSEASESCLGLGVVVCDFCPAAGNEVFVGNDVYPDQLWVRMPQGQRWQDIAPISGCAFGVRGSKTASMGIAAGDVDNSGTLDLHITNFQDRNSSLFLNLGDAFLERNVEYGLATPSQSVLGWGTQVIDYDRDSRLDLVVTNGHVEKSLTISAPFEQHAQLFANRGNRFDCVDVDDRSGYWKSRHLGRALTRLDFNRDGRTDFVITHLGEPTALLLNETSDVNHWLQLRLVGTTSERDAIGAKVEISFGRQQSTGWVIAGDGFLSKNESLVSFGLGDAKIVDLISVEWPSGIRQEFQRVAVDQRLLVVENDASIHRLPISTGTDSRR